MPKPYLVFDVGGTTIKYALIDAQHQLQQTHKCPTARNKDGHILKTLQKISADYQARYPLAGIGVSTAGIVGPDGSIQYAGPTIPGYQGTPIQKALAQQTGLPVFVVNDVDAALLGEQLAGAAQAAKTIYCVALGTGIGGAYLHHGQLFSGAHGTANSIGYTLYRPQQQTKYEQRAATLALEATLKNYDISVPAAFEKAKQQQAPYQTIIEAWADEVAAGLAQILLFFDPEVLLIGGAVSQQGAYLQKLLQTKLAIYLPAGLCQTELKMAELADKAQLYGALAGVLKLEQAKR